MIAVLSRAAALLGVMFLLAGCAATSPRDVERRPPRESIRAFEIEGRVSVKRGTENYAASLAWTHIGARDEILVTSPLGQGLAALVGDASGAQLETADKQRYSAPDVESLSQQVFGSRLPLRDMPAWVIGQTSAMGKVESDSQGRPQSIVEQGWVVRYLSYENERADALPTLLHMQYGDLEVRLKIDTWNLAQ